MKMSSYQAFFYPEKQGNNDLPVSFAQWVQKVYLFFSYFSIKLNPCHAEPGYVLPLQTV